MVVTSADLVTATLPTAGQFFVDNEGDGTGAVSIVSNGQTSAQGSLQMSTTGTGSHWQVVTDDRSGTVLSNITSLSYTANTNRATCWTRVCSW